LIDDCFQLRPTGSQKTLFFLKEKHDFSKNRLSKLTSIFDPILMPTCLHVGLPNRRFFKKFGFQEAFKILSFLASIFHRFWVRLGLQHGALLEAKMAQNSKKWHSKFSMLLPKSGSENDAISTSILERLGSAFGGQDGPKTSNFRGVRV